jgi:hypothetical protein
MARPPLPTALQELKGAHKKDPQRKRPNKPAANGPIGDAPASFNEDDVLTELWHELLDLVPAKVLARADRWSVEVACRMMKKLRRGFYSAAEANILLSCLSRMGLTPADPSKRLSRPPRR